jgi:hypothetical protein
MSSAIRPAAAIAVVIAALAAAPDVRAQVGADPEPASVRRPYRGLFGAPPDASAPQSLVLSGSVYGAYDDNIIEGLSERQSRNSWMQRSGTYWGTYGGIDYTLTKPGERFSFGARSWAQLHYREAIESYVTPYYSGELHMDARLRPSTTLSASQSASYEPNYRATAVPLGGEAFGPDVLVPPDPDLDLFALQAFRMASRLTLSQRIGRNTTLAGSYQFRTFDIDEADLVDADLDSEAGRNSRFRDYRSHSGSAMLMHTRRLTPHAELALGYGLRVSDGRGYNAEPPVMHNVNAGVNYSRALSFSRRTSFRFGSGSAIVVTEQDRVTRAGKRTQFHVLGNANLVHEMGRTWTAELTYARGLVSREGFSELYFTDALTATLGGLMSRRVSFSAAATWALSTLDRPGRNRHDGLFATAQFEYALTRYLAVYTRYLNFRYDYGEDIPLDPRFARGMERQGVRVGLTTSVPLIR